MALAIEPWSFSVALSRCHVGGTLPAAIESRYAALAESTCCLSCGNAVAHAEVKPGESTLNMSHSTSTALAFQDYYPEQVAHCYGCGRLNEQGLQIKTRWEGEESVTRFWPRPEHIAIPGFVYGGLIASLIDCHGTGTAAAALYRAEGREMSTLPAFRFVTASLKVDYLRPTPMDTELELRGRVIQKFEKRVVVSVALLAKGQLTAKGEVVAVQMPESFELANSPGVP